MNKILERAKKITDSKKIGESKLNNAEQVVGFIDRIEAGFKKK